MLAVIHMIIYSVIYYRSVDSIFDEFNLYYISLSMFYEFIKFFPSFYSILGIEITCLPVL